jgi:hypothetical protein
MANWLDAVIEAFNDLHGSDETLKILMPLAKQIGTEGGKYLVGENPGMKNDAATIGQLVNALGEVLMQHGNVQLLSADELRKEITDCPFQIFPYEMCKVLESLMQGVIEAINPDLDYSYEKMMTKGDKTCCWHVRNKGITPTIILDDVNEPKDPMAILKMRLAKGEIDSAKYEEVKALISP